MSYEEQFDEYFDEWEYEFIGDFYALLKKHTGVDFNEERKDFDLYCSVRDKIREKLQKRRYYEEERN